MFRRLVSMGVGSELFLVGSQRLQWCTDSGSENMQTDAERVRMSGHFELQPVKGRTRACVQLCVLNVSIRD